jgi:2',3'-cyclic-nucleotide 2'-phosphodiesterase
MRILFIGDIVSEPGRNAVKELLPQIKTDFSPDIVIANAENITHGRGFTKEAIEEMQNVGVDFFTGGDHTFWQKGSEDIIDSLPMIRPANYPPSVAGSGYKIVDLGSKGTILIINILGRVFFSNQLDSPFNEIDKILEEHKDQNITEILVDFHAEATSEKYAMGFYLDGRVSAVIGTHTHVPTCDHRILPKGTAFVSDAGMTGNIDSVLGVKTEIIQKLFLTGINQRFEWESAGKKAFRSVIIDTAEKTIERVDRS